MNSQARRRWVHLLFFLSGIPGLVAQLAWSRILTAGLGHEFPAVMGVVSAYFAGMAAGAWGLDRLLRRTRHPVQVYAGLELFSFAWIALITPMLGVLIDASRQLIGVDPMAWKEALVGLSSSFFVVGPAAAAMGGTLPAMERAVAPLVPEGRAVAGLYAANTAGALVGIVAALWVLMPWLGFRGTLWAAAGLQAVCGLGALVLAGRGPGEIGAIPGSQAVPSSTLEARADLPGSRSAPRTLAAGRPETAIQTRLGGRILVIAFASGLLGLGFEVLGIRALAQTTENTLHTFGAALGALLLGSALGAGWLRAAVARNRDPSVATLLGWVAAVILVEVCLLTRSEFILEWARGHVGQLSAELSLAALVFVPPAIPMGALFSRVVQGAPVGAGSVARAVAANALGGALASPVWIGFILPAAGLKWSLAAVSLGYLLMRLPPWRMRALGAIAAVLAVVWLLPSQVRQIQLPPGATVTRFEEGRLATVAVIRTADGARTLRVNRHFQQGGTATSQAARRQAVLPLLLHPDPHRVLFLGVGTGITMGSAAAFDGLAADGVELLPEIVAALRDFEPENGSPQRRPGFRVMTADARRFVRTTDAIYDVVVGDLFHPAEDGAGFLYTREHFAALRGRLAPGGLVCQWLPLHQLDDRGFQDIAATFLSVFPSASLWLLRFNLDVPVVGLLSRADGQGWDPVELGRRMTTPGLEDFLRPLALTDPVRLLGCRIADNASLRRLAEGGSVGTDDFPVVLFRAPSATYRSVAQPHRLLLRLIDQADPGIERLLIATADPAWKNRVAAFRQARDAHLRGLAKEAEGRRRDAIEDYVASAAASADFTAGYAQAVLVASAYANEDRPWAREILRRLVRARPEQRLAGELLGRLEP